MTGLLVSVRSAAEAEIALAGGADLIDIKEPSRGPLGAADPRVWEEVRRVVAGRVPTSAALGELLTDPAVESARHSAGFTYAKVGLSGCKSEIHWRPQWIKLVEQLPAGVTLVPVAYADWHRAECGPVFAHAALAATMPGKLLVIDTFDKSGGNLLEYLALDEFRELGETSRVNLVLAGSLGAEAIQKLLPIAPAYFGVRGAVCRGGRTGAIDRALVKRLAELVHSRASSAGQIIG